VAALLAHVDQVALREVFDEFGATLADYAERAVHRLG